MTTPWQLWKEKNLDRQMQGRVTPTALLNPDTPMVDEFVKLARMEKCEQCPNYMKSKQCKECGCFMPIKTGLLYATCPIGEW